MPLTMGRIRELEDLTPKQIRACLTKAEFAEYLECQKRAKALGEQYGLTAHLRPDSLSERFLPLPQYVAIEAPDYFLTRMKPASVQPLKKMNSPKPARKALNETDQQAAQFILEHPGSKGDAIAVAISVTPEHFRSRIFPKLKALGYYNQNGYRAPKRPKR